MTEPKIKIGISSCLLGHKVRYDGGHKFNDSVVSILGEYFEFIPFCPEVDIGMGIPRNPIQLVLINEQVRCVDVNNPEKDMTEQLTECANKQKHWHKDICGYILKKNSPSCGMQNVKLFNDRSPKPAGKGIYAAQMMRNFPELPIEEEDRMEDPQLRENFIESVKMYIRNRNLEVF